MVFGQMFINNNGGKNEFDFAKFFNDQPDLITTFKYVPSIGDGKPCTVLGDEACTLQLNSAATPFKVYPGELTRWYIFNAGPNDGF